MIFYLCGPDHSGKSTLAQNIVKSRKANYIHCDYNKNWNLEDYHDDIGRMAVTLNSYGQDVVLDRWCLDHYAYKPFNKENAYDPVPLWNEFVKENGQDLILIYCLPANEFNPNEREEMYNDKQMRTVESRINKIFSKIDHYKYFYKTDGKDMDKFINKCIESHKLMPLNYEWNFLENEYIIKEDKLSADNITLIDDKIEFPNYGNEEQNYLKQDDIDVDKELEKDAEGFHEYLKDLYKSQMEAEENMLKKLKDNKDKINEISEIKTIEVDGTKYKIIFLKDNKEPEIKKLIGKHSKENEENMTIKNGSDLYLKILNKFFNKNEETKKVDEKSIDYSKIPRTIAVDFDGTLVKNAFPKIYASDENINWNLVNELKEEAKKGTKIILWTNRTGEALNDAVTFSNEVLGLIFDAINDNIKEVKDMGLSPRKVWFDITYDDKAKNIKF